MATTADACYPSATALQPAIAMVLSTHSPMGAQAEVMVMNMISQGQIAAGQRKLFEGFLAGVAVAAIAIALAWGAFAVVNASNSVAPSKATIQTLQQPGLLEQRAGERGGAVAAPSKTTIMTDGLVEHRRGERSEAGRSTTPTLDQSVVEHRRGEHGPLR
jgi:hypothetical protein